MLFNIEKILIPGVNCLSILLFANLITTGNVIIKMLGKEQNDEKRRFKERFSTYVLVSFETIISGLILKTFNDIQGVKYILIAWAISLIISLFLSFKNILALLEIVFQQLPEQK